MIEAGILIISCALLNRLGGSRNKLFRRVGIPLLITLYGLWRHQWYSLLCLPYGFAIFCLPITLVGDEILTDGRTRIGFDKKDTIELSLWISFPTKWVNLMWIVVLGFLMGLLTLNLVGASIYCVFYSSLVFLSNFRSTARIFTWDRCEYAFGGVLGVLVSVFNSAFF